jgi:hypothetical protein
MRIHTDKLSFQDLYDAAREIENVYVEYTLHGSRKRDHAFNVTLTAEPRKGRRFRNSGNRGATYDAAATWDEWGIFLNHLFTIDPNAASDNYDGLADFRFRTGERFDTADFTPCDQHKWEVVQTIGPVHVVRCAKGCGAIKRY